MQLQSQNFHVVVCFHDDMAAANRLFPPAGEIDIASAAKRKKTDPQLPSTYGGRVVHKSTGPLLDTKYCAST